MKMGRGGMKPKKMGGENEFSSHSRIYLGQRGQLPRRWKRLIAYFFLAAAFLAGAFLAAGFLAAGFLAASFLTGAFMVAFFTGIKNPPFHPQLRRVRKR